MKLYLEDCVTIKECFLWADQEWPMFWDFATQQKLTKPEIISLWEDVDRDDNKFQQFMDRMVIVAKMDRTEEAKRYLILGAGAFVRLENQIKEIQDHD